jgi:N-formylglutamate deformylase
MEPVFEVLAGAADSPVILHVPHASRVIPPAVRAGILLDDAALAAELDHMTDAHTDVIAERAARAAAVPPWRFVNLASRLVVDPERFPDDQEEMAAVGMGAVYTRTSHREPLRPEPPSDADDLIATRFRPYAEGMTELVEDRLAACGRAVIIDVHSYPTRALPYELHGADLRPAVCLGTDGFHTPAWLADAAAAAFAACGDLGWNTPFAGCYVPLAHYAVQPAVSALMVEIRRDGYMTEPGGEPTDGLLSLATALATLVDVAGAR